MGEIGRRSDVTSIATGTLLARYCRSLWLLLTPLMAIVAQTEFTVSGDVVDASNGKPLPAATVRVAGVSNIGTITNERGQFQLPLQPGAHTLIVTYLGYRSDTLQVSMNETSRLRAALRPEAIRMPEVVVTDEDPAIAIIRRAIENKPKWMGRLKTFQCEAYSRNTITIDTAIAAITESFETLYWRQNDSLREVIHQKRQTRNLPVGDMINRVGQVTNFNDDTIRTGGFAFIGPTSPDAFSHYDYKLLRTRSMDGMDVYDIDVIPRSRIRPLFRGTISIAERSYAVINVDFVPNEAYSIPFISDLKFHYLQQFRLYEERYWMPVDYRVQGAAQVGFAGLINVRFALNRYVVMSDYTINPLFADTLAMLPKFTLAPQAVTPDSVYWAQHVLLPLNIDEESAYRRLDSTETLDKQFGRRTGTLNALGATFDGLSYFDLRFNRVEGFFLGGKFELDSATNSLALRGGAGYGFSDKRWKYEVGGTYYLTEKRSLGVGVDVYRALDNRPDENFYPPFEILLASLFDKNDYLDYFLSTGWKSFVEAKFLYGMILPRLTLRLTYTDEQEMTMGQKTNFSILRSSREFRPNPPIVDGRLRSISLSGELGNSLQYLFSNPYVTAHASVEYSSPRLLRSDFEFTRISGGVKAKFPTYDLNLFFNPTMSVSFLGGIISGTPVPQRIFDLESSYEGTSWFGSLKGVEVKEFSGDRYVLLSVEHNFRRLPFLATGIPFIYNNNLEMMVFGSVAQTWFSSSSRRTIPPSFVTTNGWYYEGGIGVGRILELFRLDLTWRGKEPRGLSLTVGISDIL